MKVGDYVRTETGQIGKISYFEGDMVRVDCDKFITYKSNHNEIIKISSNIIDLIEVGDYVNSSKVLDIAQAPKKAIYTEQESSGALLPIVNNRIESILTKEQFESMEYKVGE